MNKVLYCTEPGQFQYGKTTIPEFLNNHAIIKIERVGICGTDLHAFEGTQPYFSYPRVLGHELAGTLVAADGASGFEPGERVTFIPYFHCGSCIACRSGKSNCCSQIQVCGVHVDGGMTNYLRVPSATLIHGDGLSFEALALVEPLAIGAHGVRRASIQPGEFVLVIGAGPIGLGIMEFARIAGGIVIAMDINPQRLNFCKNKLNVQYTINPAMENADDVLRTITSGDYPTVAIDATGNQRAINNGFSYLAHGGRYVLVGLQKGEIAISHPEFHKREATLMSSRNATRVDFMHVIDVMKKDLIDPTNYITHRVGFDQVKDEFHSWLDPNNSVIKAMVYL